MERTITVTGQGTSSVAPDIATVTIGVSAVAADVRTAAANLAASVSDITGALVSNGVAEVTTGHLGIHTNRDNHGREAGFRAESTLAATTALIGTDGSEISRMVGAAVDAGGEAVAIHGISLRPLDDVEARRESAAAAFRDARAAAEALATEAGCRIGPVITMQLAGSGHGGGPRPMAKAMRFETMDVPVHVGDESVATSVQVTFALA